MVLQGEGGEVGVVGEVAARSGGGEQPGEQTLDGKIIAVPTYHAASGMMTSVTYPAADATNIGNGTKGSFTIDTRGRPAGMSWNRASDNALITSESVTRSPAGRITDQTIDQTIDANPAGANFEYDPVGRLTRALVPGHDLVYDFTSVACAAGPPPAFRAAASAQNGSGATTLVINRPAGTQAGDVLVAQLTQRGTSATLTPPAGWTQIQTAASGTSVRTVTWWRVAAAGDPTSWTWTASASTQMAGGIAAFSGIDPTNPIDVAATSTHGADTTNHAAPSVTTTTSGGLLVTVFGVRANATWTPPSGMTERWDTKTTGSGPVAIEAATISLGAAGVSGARTAVSSSGGASANHTIALRAQNPGSGSLPDAGKNTNRVGYSDNGTYVAGYCYDVADRLVSTSHPGVGAITYNARGDVTGLGADVYTYDGAGRHMKTQNGSTTLTYQRDALDRIVARATTGATSQTQRYSHSGAGDAAAVVLDTANQVIERSVGLPGGATVTTRGGGDVWSYPSLQGHTAAIANAAGTKQGATFTYDPYGQALAGLPDNLDGDLDYGWHGQAQRGIEHTPGLQPLIQMGARPYHPALGRFLTTDPILGGGCNDYEYTCADPTNRHDLTGTVWIWDEYSQWVWIDDETFEIVHIHGTVAPTPGLSG